MDTYQLSQAHERRGSLLLCRFAFLLLILAALLVMALDRQQGFVPINIFGLPQPLMIKATAEFKLITGLKFYVVAMAAIAAYTLIQMIKSTLLLLRSKSIVGTKSMAWACFIADLAVAYLSVTVAAVSAEIAYLAKRGAPRVLWNAVCTSFSHYCVVFGFSLVLAFSASLVAFSIASISAYHLFRIYGAQQSLQQTSKGP